MFVLHFIFHTHHNIQVLYCLFVCVCVCVCVCVLKPLLVCVVLYLTNITTQHTQPTRQYNQTQTNTHTLSPWRFIKFKYPKFQGHTSEGVARCVGVDNPRHASHPHPPSLPAIPTTSAPTFPAFLDSRNVARPGARISSRSF